MRSERLTVTSSTRDVFELIRPNEDACSATQPHVTELWRAGMQAFDLLGIGWLVCDSTGRLLGSNPLASRILSTRDGLRINIIDDASDAATLSNGQLEEAVRRAVETVPRDDASSKNVCFVTKRAAGKQALTVVVRRVRTNSPSADHLRPVALVLILDPSWSAGTAESDLQHVYGFTAREAALAAMLMDGHSLHDCSTRLGISRSTASTHLKRMFRKTRVHRQSEMVSLLLKTVGLVAFRDRERNLCHLLGMDLSSIQ